MAGLYTGSQPPLVSAPGARTPAPAQARASAPTRARAPTQGAPVACDLTACTHRRRCATLAGPMTKPSEERSDQERPTGRRRRHASAPSVDQGAPERPGRDQEADGAGSARRRQPRAPKPTGAPQEAQGRAQGTERPPRASVRQGRAPAAAPAPAPAPRGDRCAICQTSTRRYLFPQATETWRANGNSGFVCVLCVLTALEKQHPKMAKQLAAEREEAKKRYHAPRGSALAEALEAARSGRSGG